MDPKRAAVAERQQVRVPFAFPGHQLLARGRHSRHRPDEVAEPVEKPARFHRPRLPLRRTVLRHFQPGAVFSFSP